MSRKYKFHNPEGASHITLSQGATQSRTLTKPGTKGHLNKLTKTKHLPEA